MPLLRRPDHRHRDLRKGLPAETPPAGPLQQRSRSTHLMIPSRPVHQPSDARDSPGFRPVSSLRLPVDKSVRSGTANPSGNARCARSTRHPQPSCEGKPIGAGALIQPPQTQRRGRNPPIQPRQRTVPSRDFRASALSDAGRPSAFRARHRRRPKILHISGHPRSRNSSSEQPTPFNRRGREADQTASANDRAGWSGQGRRSDFRQRFARSPEQRRDGGLCTSA